MKGEGRPFWKAFLQLGVMRTIIKVFIILYPARENGEHPGNFQNESVGSAFN